MAEATWVYTALGSNLGDRDEYLRLAREELARLPDTVVERVSSVEETEPLGPVHQGPYLNQMVLLRTGLSPHRLLSHCRAIEQLAGRVRQERWGARTLDLDIVRFGDLELNDPDLVVPHPEIGNRDFWQRELAELEPYARP